MRWEESFLPDMSRLLYASGRGPDCGPYNKRYELVTDPVGQERFTSILRQKIHIREAVNLDQR